MELVPPLEEDLTEATEVLEDLLARSRHDKPAADNPSKRLAQHLVGKIPVIYGARGVGATAAYRFKCDLNEYAKTPAFWNELPELDHNEIESWQEAELTKGFALVMLRDGAEDPAITRRFDITKQLIGAGASDVSEVCAEGKSALARLLSLLLITQLSAIYLAVARGVDPGTVEVLEELKRRLAEG
jgi:glucose/mannose-6-phosphate isomerase